MDVKGRLIEMSDGTLVESDVYHIVQKVAEYDPNLRIKIPRNPEMTDAPYALFELCPDGVERLVFEIWELDDRVVDRVRYADTQKRNVLLDLDGNNLLAKRTQRRRYEEKKLETQDIITTMLRSPKGRWTWKSDEGKLVQFDDSVNGYNGEVNESRAV